MRLGGPLFATADTPESWVAAVRAAGYRAAYCPVALDATAETISTISMYIPILSPNRGSIEDISSSRGCIIGCSLTTLETVQIMSSPTITKASSTLRKMSAM